MPTTTLSPKKFKRSPRAELHVIQHGKTIKRGFSKPPDHTVWRVVQTASWIIGAGIVISLVVAPDTGLHLLWNILIPTAPALFTFIPGIWRNVCPLGSTALLPRHWGFSRPVLLTLEWQSRLGLLGVALLVVLIPLRHAVLNLNGPATALTLAVMVLGAIIAGMLFEWKSGWCAGACPVFQVEKLYGGDPALTVPNAHCSTCNHCTAPCIDSSPRHYSFTRYKDPIRNLTTLLMLGGFPGFLWGWFHVPDYAGTEGWNHLGLIYGYPLAGGTITCMMFWGLHSYLPGPYHASLIRIFVAGAISCYYWYRIPALVGMGLFPGEGMLIDLTATIPEWSVWVSRLFTTTLFFWWFFRSGDRKHSWTIRPALSPS